VALIIFSSLDISCQKLSYFRWFIWAAENCTLFSVAQLRPTKIELFSVVFPVRPSNVIGLSEIGNFSYSHPSVPLTCPHSFHLSSCRLLPPPPSSTARCRRSPSSRRSSTALPHHPGWAAMPPPSNSVCQPGRATEPPSPPCLCTTAGLRVPSPSVPPPTAVCLSRLSTGPPVRAGHTLSTVGQLPTVLRWPAARSPLSIEVRRARHTQNIGVL
jgi:hypothetical protein